MLCSYLIRETLTIGNVGNLTEDVVSADLFVALWWTNESLADHGNIDFGTNTPVCRLEVKHEKHECKQCPVSRH